MVKKQPGNLPSIKEVLERSHVPKTMATYTSKSEYSKKFKDPRWQRKRLKIMNRDDFTCRICDSNKDTLNVHHLFYVMGCEPWEYPDPCFLTLCESCHKSIKDVDFARQMALEVVMGHKKLIENVMEDPVTYLVNKRVNSKEGLIKSLRCFTLWEDNNGI